MAEETTAVPRLVDALRWQWKAVLLVVVPLLVGTAFYAERLPAKYTGTAIVAIEPKPNVDPNVVTVSAPKYVDYVTAPATIRQLAPSTTVSESELEHAVSAGLAVNTGNVTINVELSSPGEAAAIANQFARDLIAFASHDALVDGRLIAPAVVSTSPSGPPRRLMEAAGLVVALMIGLLLALYLERSRPRLRSWRDIVSVTGFPVLGRLPVSQAARRGAPGRAMADPPMGAAVRSLRTNLERQLGDHMRKAIAVTSVLPGEGKSTVAALLAASLARLNVRVLLVDGDLRRAGLTKALRMDNGPGLARILHGRAPFPKGVEEGWHSGLRVLPTIVDPEAGDLLARHFGDFVRNAKDSYDVVVIDSPPLLGTDDAATIATHADGVLLVVAEGTVADRVNEAAEILQGLRVEVWGAIANRFRERGPAAQGYYLR